VKLAQAALLLRQFGASLRDLRRYGILTNLEQSQIAVHEFTAVFPVAAGSGPDLIAAIDAFAKLEAEHPRLRHIPGLHTARWVPLRGFDPRQPQSAAVKPPPFALVFAFICDGNVLDVLDELFAQVRDRIDTVLQHCAGFSNNAAYDAWLGYFRRYRVRSNYLFRDSRQHDPHAPPLHPSAHEIRRALLLRKRFRAFVVRTQGKPAAARRDAFLQQFGPVHAPATEPRDRERGPVVGPLFALSPFERPLDREGMWIRRAADLAQTRARRDARQRARAGLTPVALRGVHAKHHGLLKARFRVRDDLPERLRRGIFIPGREYDAWLRPSNSDMNQRPDWLPDARGLAIKLVGVDGPQLIQDRPIPNGLGLPDGHTQDFTLVTHPTFFVKDLRDYAILRSFIDVRPEDLRERLGVAAGVLAFAGARPRELSIFLQTLLRWCRHPLLPTYHSLLPFLVGPNEVAKCSVTPTEATRAILERATPLDLLRDLTDDSSNYLRRALQRSLDALGSTPLVFEFALHVPREEPLPIEDPRIDWRPRAERIVVASLTIMAQNATSTERMASAEGMVVTPWHGLVAHRPLGSLNRGRMSVYLASARQRWRSDTPPPDVQKPKPPTNGVEHHVANGGGDAQ
jgi:hypothetical protein